MANKNGDSFSFDIEGLKNQMMVAKVPSRHLHGSVVHSSVHACVSVAGLNSGRVQAKKPNIATLPRSVGPTQPLAIPPDRTRQLMKALHFGVAYGASSKVSMSTARRLRTLTEPLPDAHLPAGYHPACAECPQGLNCIRKKLPSICNHCRRMAPTLTDVDLRILQLSRAKDIEVTVDAAVDSDTVHVDVMPPAHTAATRIDYGMQLFQLTAKRAPSACPLFYHSLMTCEACEKPRQTQVYIQTGRYKRKRLKVPGIITVLAPRKTLRDFVVRNQQAPKNLHERAVHRHEQKDRRPKRGARHRKKTKR